MPYKVTRDIEAAPSTTVVSTYVTASPVAVAATHMALYFDLSAANMYRGVEMHSRIWELRDRMREDTYERPTVAAGYWTMPLAGGKGNISFAENLTEVVDGVVAIGIGATIQSDNKSSGLVDVAIMELFENFRKTVLVLR